METEPRINGKLIHYDILTNVLIEKSELERLLREVNERARLLLKKKGLQTWFDWIMEQIGY
jgi:hypothetical protein